MIYISGVVIAYLLQLLLKLDGELSIVMLLFVLFMLPFHQRRYQHFKDNQIRFREVSMYLDTLLYAFEKEEKVDLAIRDVSMTLPQGKMKKLVEHAYIYMNTIFEEKDVIESALHMIEKEYPCRRIKDVHQFIMHVEYYGGEVERPIRLLLTDKNRWEQRVNKTIAERKKQVTDVVLSVVASLLICSAMVYLPIGDMAISHEPIVGVCALLVVVADEWIIYQAQRYLEVDWLRLQFTEEESYYIKKMSAFYSYNEEKEKRLSVLFGGIGFIITALAFASQKEWLVAVCMGMTLFFFQQHKIRRNLEIKTLTKEIKYAFPNWLMDLVLLLQSENVQVALHKSKEHVPGVLRKELFLLTERLEIEPESSVPYHAFLKEFSIPEIHSAMGILYSISIGNSGNADKQISELVEKNLELLDETEKEKLRAAASGLYVLFLLPVMVASFKLVVDMVFMMLRFIQIPSV